MQIKRKIKEKWLLIPSKDEEDKVDILLTHMPPFGIMDTAANKDYDFKDRCNECGYIHKWYRHWGNVDLLKQVKERIKPKVHLFGHVHQAIGYEVHKDKDDEIVFINSAMDLKRIPHQFHVVFDL